MTNIFIIYYTRPIPCPSTKGMSWHIHIYVHVKVSLMKFFLDLNTFKIFILNI